ncbi:heme ABC transporter ATP-binding protein [Sneathiella limimaris]|uniref:heme ABC transporter ATP-binding protein n=1 Tax=Sneathiella limimaris TaxID=1964213 RepID=UPI00146CE1FB|nr:heme ABC transporter ATP-binding protein [Sneathiella limimaris]
MLRAQNLSFQIAGKEILVDISVEVNRGQIFGILGPNGAGKSTLLKCLSGYHQPTSGEIYLLDQPLNDYALEDLSHKRAVLTQNITLNFPFKVLEIASMGRGQQSGLGHSEKDLDIAREALKLTDVLHLADRQFTSLSGGEQQRVHMARVLAQLWEQDGALLFLDEPTSALDLKHQFHLFDLCRDLAQQRNYAICVVLHDLHLARQVCDRVQLLRHGQDFASGATEEVLTVEKVSSLYEIPKERVHL